MKTKTIGTLLIAGLIVLSVMVVFASTAAAEVRTQTITSDDPNIGTYTATFEFTEETTEDFEKTPKTSGNTTKVYREESVTRSKSKSSTTCLGNSLLYTDRKWVLQPCYNKWYGKHDVVYTHNFDVTNLHTIYSAQITIWASDVNSYRGEDPAVYVNGNYIGNLTGVVPRATTLSIDPSYLNVGTNTVIIKDNYGWWCYIWASKLEIDYDTTEESIPEFATIAIPVAAILGLFFFYNRRKRGKE